MYRRPTFRPDVNDLERRWLPTVSGYTNALQADLASALVAEAATKSNDVVFLGDSITQWWDSTAAPGTSKGLFASEFGNLKAADMGIAGDNTDDILYRIRSGDLAGQPKVVVLMIGINNLIQGQTPDETAAGVASVVDAIHGASPESHVLLLGILPTDVPSLTAGASAVDAQISGLGAESYVTYANPGALFAQADGSADPALLKDAVHPDAAGYQVLAGAIDGTLVRLLRESTPPPAASTTTTTTAKVAAVAPVVETPAATLVPLTPDDGADADSDATAATTSTAARTRSFATELVDAGIA